MGQAQFDPGRRTRAQRAVNANRATHEFDQLSAQHEPQSGTAVKTCRGAVDLFKEIKNAHQVIGRNADSGIAHREAQLGFPDRLLEHFDLNFDPSPGGVFDGVARQFLQNLSQPQGITLQRQIAQRLLGMYAQFQAFLGGLRFKLLHDAVQNRSEMESARLNGELA